MTKRRARPQPVNSEQIQQAVVGVFGRLVSAALEGAVGAVLGEVQQGVRAVDERLTTAQKRVKGRRSPKPKPEHIDVEVVEVEGRRH